MKIRGKIVLLLIVIVLVSGTYGYFRHSRSAGGSGNVLLISIDTLRPDHLGAYGYERDTSPNIDGVARRGSIFLNAISTTSWTLPAHVSLLTGMDIATHGVANDGISIHPDIPLLAESLQAAGWRTAAFCSSPYLNPAFGFGRGFDLYHNTDLEKSDFEDTVFLEDRYQWNEVHADITSPRIEELTVDWLDKNKGEKFFLFLHLWDPHFDFIPPPPYDTLFDPDYQGEVSPLHFMFNEAINPNMDPRDLEHIIALYDGEIAFTDHYLGLIFRRLKELDLWEDTLVIITGDHGEEFFEHGLKGHRESLYDETVKIPLIIKLPGGAGQDRKIAQQVSIIDIAVTILDYLGIEPPPPMQGVSLLPLIRGEDLPDDRGAFLELDYILKAFRTNGFKLLFNVDHLQTTILDLKKDKKETHQHLVTSEEEWSEANRRFYSRMEEDRRLADEYRDGKTGADVHLSPEQIQKLKSLGYIR